MSTEKRTEVKVGKGPDERMQNAPSLWHLRRNKTEAAKALVEWNDECIVANWPRASRTYLYGSAFEGFQLMNLSGFGCDVQVQQLAIGAADVSIMVNRVRSMAVTFVAKTGANDDPVPQFVTNDGDFEQQQKAEEMDGVVCAEYEQQHGGYADFHSLCRKLELMVTSCLGRGWMFVFPGNYGGRIKPEAEIDDGLTIGVVREHQYGRILRLCRSTYRDPEALIAKYPKKKAAILANVEVLQAHVKSGSALPVSLAAKQEVVPTQRLVREIQGWHISSGKNDPGREMFCLKDGTWLEDNVWNRDKPPCRSIDYEEELSAAGGTPLTHNIYQMFIAENRMYTDMDQLEQRMPYEVLVAEGGDEAAAAVKKQIESSKGVEVVGIPPGGKLTSMGLSGLPRKTTELVDRLANLQHEMTGVSRGHSDATQPKGINSGVQASLEASLFPERHADFVLRFNRFRAVDCAELFVWAIQDIVASKEDYAVWAGDSDVKKLIKGGDLDLDMNKYRIQVKPASARKDSVSTRLQKAERWLEDPTVQFTGADMAQFWKTYDVDDFSDELDGITKGVRKQIKKWRSLPLLQARAQYRSPAKWFTIQGLESALRIVVADYEEARDSNVPEDRLRLWENYMNQCTAILRTLKEEEARLAALASGKVAGANGSPVQNPAAAAAPRPGGSGGVQPVPAGARPS